MPVGRPLFEWIVFRPEDGLSHNVVNDIIQTRDGVLWFARQDGICSYDGVRWYNYSEEDGLECVGFASLHEAEDGTLWATESRHVLRDSTRKHV